MSSAADVMREEVAMIARVMKEQDEILAKPLSMLAQRLHGANIEHIYLVGCGDSAFAGAATALAFQKHAGVHAEGIHALEMARYRVRYLPQHSAVVCISFSGMVGRTIEAAKQARRFGHRVLALTGNPDSPLEKEATDVITLSVPTLGYSPGTSTYLAILAALLDLSVAWGEARGSHTVMARALLLNVADHAQHTLVEVNEPVHEMAEWILNPGLVFLFG